MAPAYAVQHLDERNRTMENLEPPKHPDPAGEATDRRAACLREEIDFWLGMLEAADDTVPAESIERMTFALALAEFRLRELNCIGSGRPAERAFS